MPIREGPPVLDLSTIYRPQRFPRATTDILYLAMSYIGCMPDVHAAYIYAGMAFVVHTRMYILDTCTCACGSITRSRVSVSRSV